MERNLKDSAVEFLQLVSSGKIREAYQLYVGEDFRHHNPYFKGDKESLMTAMEEDARRNPNKVLEVKHALQDNGFVVVHSHIRQNPDEPGAAFVHIFRFRDDLVEELWDLGMPVPMDNPNENGMF